VRTRPKRRGTFAFCAFTFSAALTVAGEAPPGAASQPSPEIEKTVDAVVGKWSGSMTATIPGFPPETFPWRVECMPVALGSGAACTMTGKAPIGEMAQACLVAPGRR
jgi:hypothetical protein